MQTPDSPTPESCDCFQQMYLLERHKYWRLRVSPQQGYLGWCLIVLLRHETNVAALTAEEIAELWVIIRRARATLGRLFAPDHFNYAFLGNIVRHVHMHLMPRTNRHGRLPRRSSSIATGAGSPSRAPKKRHRKCLRHSPTRCGKSWPRSAYNSPQPPAKPQLMTNACEICDAPWPELGSFRHWRVTVAREQNYLGKCILALRQHEEDFLALRTEEREEMWQAASAVRDALTRCFAPDHFNYQALGNSVRHVHMHLTPRYTSPREFAGLTFIDEHWGTWPYPAKQDLPPALLKTLAETIAREMLWKGAAK